VSQRIDANCSLLCLFFVPSQAKTNPTYDKTTRPDSGTCRTSYSIYCLWLCLPVATYCGHTPRAFLQTKRHVRSSSGSGEYIAITSTICFPGGPTVPDHNSHALSATRHIFTGSRSLQARPGSKPARIMRRGVGVKHIKRKEKETEAFTTLGKELQEENIQHVAGLMATFKESLEEFARKHKKDINANPVLRAEVRWSVRVWEDRGRGGWGG
jgi:hypothetical protein